MHFGMFAALKCFTWMSRIIDSAIIVVIPVTILFMLKAPSPLISKTRNVVYHHRFGTVKSAGRGGGFNTRGRELGIALSLLRYVHLVWLQLSYSTYLGGPGHLVSILSHKLYNNSVLPTI